MSKSFCLDESTLGGEKELQRESQQVRGESQSLLESNKSCFGRINCTKSGTKKAE